MPTAATDFDPALDIVITREGGELDVDSRSDGLFLHLSPRVFHARTRATQWVNSSFPASVSQFLGGVAVTLLCYMTESSPYERENAAT